jgi:hypothetical protein
LRDEGIKTVTVFDPDLFDHLRAALVALGFPEDYDNLHALCYAMAEQESVVTKGGAAKATALALPPNHNAFGIKWNKQTDHDRYERVRFARPNQFETAAPWYRVYRSYEHCVENWLWQMFASEFRAGAMRAFAVEAATSWCQENPRHAKAVVEKWEKWKRQLNQ